MDVWLYIFLVESFQSAWSRGINYVKYTLSLLYYSFFLDITSQ
jgi:hypothetical protein